MGRSIFLTDYSHQPITEIKKDLLEWIDSINKTLIQANKILNELGKDWELLGADDFRICALTSIQLLETAKDDISFVSEEMKNEIKDYHVRLLKKLGVKGSELNKEIGLAKHRGGRRINDKEYALYTLLRNSVYNLVDLQELSARLNDFVGVKKRIVPWFNILNTIIALGALVVAVIALNKPDKIIIHENLKNSITQQTSYKGKLNNIPKIEKLRKGNNK